MVLSVRGVSEGGRGGGERDGNVGLGEYGKQGNRLSFFL